MKTKIKDKRKKLNVGAIPSNILDLSTWNKEQIRLAGAWSKHEIEAKYDQFCQPYDYVPDWIGILTAEQVNELVCEWYSK